MDAVSGRPTSELESGENFQEFRSLYFWYMRTLVKRKRILEKYQGLFGLGGYAPSQIQDYHFFPWISIFNLCPILIFYTTCWKHDMFLVYLQNWKDTRNMYLQDHPPKVQPHRRQYQPSLKKGESIHFNDCLSCIQHHEGASMLNNSEILKQQLEFN